MRSRHPFLIRRRQLIDLFALLPPGGRRLRSGRRVDDVLGAIVFPPLLDFDAQFFYRGGKGVEKLAPSFAICKSLTSGVCHVAGHEFVLALHAELREVFLAVGFEHPAKTFPRRPVVTIFDPAPDALQLRFWSISSCPTFILFHRSLIVADEDATPKSDIILSDPVGRSAAPPYGPFCAVESVR